VTSRRIAVLVWVGVIVASGLVVARSSIDTDMSAFLPRTPSPAQRVLVDQLRDGVASRLVLVAIEDVPAERSAAINQRLAALLRGSPDFVMVENGEESGFARDRDYLWPNRYLLSDQIKPERFTRNGLRTALQRDLDALGSTAGFLVKRTLAADPTGEFLHLIERQMENGGGPDRRDGVWVSPDGARSLMLARLRAQGSDIDGAERALARIRVAFHEALNDQPDQAAKLIMTGPPVFAVEARDRIKSDATRLSAMASMLVAAVLLAAYHSPRVLALAFVPVLSGAVVGIAAVSLVFRTVHGITLGFGATLIGEAVDYAVYLFTQTAPESSIGRTLERIWPTLRLGVLTSICGFSAMLLSSFEGFAQLGLFTITGLAVAVCVTRWVLPVLIPSGFAGVRQSRTFLRVATIALRARTLRLPIAGLVAIAAASLALTRGEFWAGDLSSLSPLPPQQQQLDRSLRRDLRAPDAAYLVVVGRPDQENALEATERITASLVPLLREGGLAGIDAPSQFLPSVAAQRARQSALPDPTTLQTELDAASENLPFRLDLFAPFVAAIDTARSGAPITHADLDGTSLSLKLDSLLVHQAQGWLGMLSLRGVTAPQRLAAAIAGEPGAVLVDLKTESNRLLRVYLREGVSLASAGTAAIGLLLLASLRSLRRLLTVLAPLLAAVVVTLALLRLDGHALSIFNLFGLLLVVAIGSNYCLFLERQRGDPAAMPRVLASLLLANLCTVAGFGVLAQSYTPVLHDLGMPVAIGTFLSLVFATIIISPSHCQNVPASLRAEPSSASTA